MYNHVTLDHKFCVGLLSGCMVDLRGRSDRVGPHVRRDTLDMPGGVAVDSWPWIMELELSVRVDARYQQCGVLTLRAR